MTDERKSRASSLPGNWGQMTAEQKRQFRLNKLLEPGDTKFVSGRAEQNFKVRAQRMVDVYNLREPDRVHVSLPVGSLPLINYGINMHTAMYDYEKAVKACQKFNEEYSAELEYFAAPGQTPGRVLELLDYRLYAWPGHGISIDAPGYQFIEGEYMRADEYDDMMRDPSDFWLRTYLPRICGSCESFRYFSSLTDIVQMPTSQLSPLALPQVQESLQKLIDIGKELQKRAKATEVFRGMGAANGFPGGMGALATVPFDAIGDTLRGTSGIMMDMYRRPDKLLKAMDVIADLTVHSFMTSPNFPNMLMASFPLHKGADGWMSQKQFEKFYWPSMKKVMDALINEGLIIMLFAEGSYNTRLEFVNQFPRGTVVWWFDQTDMARAKRILGDRCCIQGNVPASMLVTAEYGEVKAYCRKLIEDCGKGGGYILSAGCVPDNPKLENLRAMMDAIKEYGVYKR